MSHKSLGEVASMFFGQSDIGQLMIWLDSNTVAPHIEELQNFQPFGPPSSSKGPHVQEIIDYCKINKENGSYTLKVPRGRESWKAAEHFARAVCFILMENSYKDGVLGPEKNLDYEASCTAIIYLIRAIRYEHNQTRRGKFSSKGVSGGSKDNANEATSSNSSFMSPQASPTITRSAETAHSQHAPAMPSYPQRPAFVHTLPIIIPRTGDGTFLRVAGMAPPPRTWSYDIEVPELPRQIHVDRMLKLGLSIEDNTSQMHQEANPQIVEHPGNIAALAAFKDWTEELKDLGDNSVNRAVNSQLLKLAIAGDFLGFWDLKNRFYKFILNGW